MPRQLMSPDECLAILESTPARIAEATRGLSSDDLRRPIVGEWSATDVLAHVRACEDARGQCIPRIIAEDHPTIRAVNPRVLIETSGHRNLDFRDSLEAFTKQRSKLARTLEKLPPEAWSRSATFTGAGAPLERSVLFYANWVARHERPHVKQIEALGNRASTQT